MAVQRVSADEFLTRLTTAEQWNLLHSPFEHHILELWVVDGDSAQCYIPPNFLEMRELEVKVFFQRLNQFLSDPATIQKRVQNYQKTRKAIDD